MFTSTIELQQGSKAGEKLLESLAEKLRESLVRGNLYIGNWERDKGSNINVTNGFYIASRVKQKLVSIRSGNQGRSRDTTW